MKGIVFYEKDGIVGYIVIVIFIYIFLFFQFFIECSFVPFFYE